MTQLYNENMKHILHAQGIEVLEIQRLQQNDLSGLADLVPESTMKWLKSDMGSKIIERLNDKHGRHYLIQKVNL